MCCWTGTHRVVGTVYDYVFTVENICTGSRSDAHISRLRLYCGRDLNVTEQLVEQVTFDGRGFNIESIVDSRWNDEAGYYELLERWEGFTELHNTWEPLKHMFREAPVFIGDLLKKNTLPYSEAMLPSVPAQNVRSRKKVV